jgi:UDP-glucuronate 4-epimerase
LKILVTGPAGFIGMHTAKRRLARGDDVIGIDNINDYYYVRLKYARLEQLKQFPNFTFIKIDIVDRDAMEKLLAEHKFPRVIHLAAQAGVCHSLKNPHAYIQSNVVGL